MGWGGFEGRRVMGKGRGRGWGGKDMLLGYSYDKHIVAVVDLDLDSDLDLAHMRAVFEYLTFRSNGTILVYTTPN